MIDGRRRKARTTEGDAEGVVVEPTSTDESAQIGHSLATTELTPSDRDVAQPAPSAPPRRARLELGRRLVAIGVSADHVTVVGILLAAVTGVVIGLGHLWVAVALVTIGGLMDTLDGAVAKAAGTSSRRGAFFDSVSDRIADGLIFGGLAWYLIATHHAELALLPFAILAVSNTISYERAKAESLGYSARGGLMERAERLILLGIALLFNVVLIPLLWALLALCVFTAAQRFVKVWKQATADVPGAAARPATAHAAPAVPLATWRPARVESRWRAWREARAGMAHHGRRRVTLSSRTRPRHNLEPLSTRLRRALTPDRAAGAAVRQRSERRERAATAFRRRLGTDR